MGFLKGPKVPDVPKPPPPPDTVDIANTDKARGNFQQENPETIATGAGERQTDLTAGQDAAKKKRKEILG